MNIASRNPSAPHVEMVPFGTPAGDDMISIVGALREAHPTLDLPTLRGSLYVATQEGQRPLSLEQALRAVDLIGQARSHPGQPVSVYPQVDEVVTANSPKVTGTDDVFWTDGGLTDIIARPSH
jgi:hypothetical protein